jgi:hypothetical protein
MENASFEVSLNGLILTFDGCTLVGAKYEENTEEISFGVDWFIDESSKRIEIETTEDDRSLHDEDHDTLYAHIKIEGRTVKKLEIFEYANGTLYLELDDN